MRFVLGFAKYSLISARIGGHRIHANVIQNVALRPILDNVPRIPPPFSSCRFATHRITADIQHVCRQQSCLQTRWIIRGTLDETEIKILNMENPEKHLDEAKKQEIKERYLRDFHAFRYDHLDDLPDHRITIADLKENLYKCRGNFWNAIAGRLENLRDFGIISDPEEVAEINGFMQLLREQAPRESKYATKEDIDKINEILDRIIEILT